MRKMQGREIDERIGNVEFKKSLAELKGGLVSISAILNKHQRGELWFGVRSGWQSGWTRCNGQDIT